MSERSDGQSGLIATQLAVLMPALLLLVMLTVQFALWAHATQLADAAADAAATTAALPTASSEDAQAAAANLLAQAGNLSAVRIVVDRGGEQATAMVSGVAPNVVPGFRWSVEARAAAPRELFRPEGAR